MNEWTSGKQIYLFENHGKDSTYITVNGQILTNDSYSGGCLGRICARVCRHVGMWCTCLRIARVALVNQARIPEQVTWSAEHSILNQLYITINSWVKLRFISKILLCFQYFLRCSRSDVINWNMYWIFQFVDEFLNL